MTVGCVEVSLDEARGFAAKTGAEIVVTQDARVAADGADKTKLRVPRWQHLFPTAGDKVVAIGETGLDYYYNKVERDWQQQRFRTHIQCALEIDKPVIVHTRDAGEDTLSILKEENAERCGGVIHCFTETMEFAEKALELGFMISFSGIITFHNADALREVARQVPDRNLLIETDSPYLAPAPHRGKQNYPAHVRHVAEKLAYLRESSVEEIAAVSRDNYYRLFHPCR